MSSLPADFTPVRQEVTAVSVARNAQVTTAADHGYLSNEYVRLIVPKAYGMDLDEVAQITVNGSDTFVTDLDTRNQATFVTPVAPPPFTQAQVVPITQLTTVVDP